MPVKFLSPITRLNWVADVITPLALVLMESFWLYPWLVFLGKWPALGSARAPLSLLSVMLVSGIVFFATRYFLKSKWRLAWARSGIVACAVLLTIMVLRIEYGDGYPVVSGRWFADYARIVLDTFNQPHPIIIAIPACIYLCWRGINLGRSQLQFESVYRSFLFGLALLVVLLVIWSATQKSSPEDNFPSTIGGYVAGFFFFGLSALALTNLVAIQSRRKTMQGFTPKLGSRWLAIVGGVIGGIVVVGMVIYSLFSTQVIASVGKLLAQIADWLYQGLYYVFVAIGFIVAGLYYVGQFIINLFTRGKTPEFEQTVEGFAPEQLLEGSTGSFPPAVLLAIKWTFFSLIAAGVIFLLARAIIRYRSARTKDEIDEEDESLWSWNVFKADIRLFLSGLMSRFKRKKEPAHHVVEEDEPVAYPGQRRLSIREIYRSLLRQAARFNVSRQRYETPNEYAYRLGQAVPGSVDSLAELTKMYVDNRYGDIEPETGAIDRANGLWGKLHALMNERGKK